MMEPQGIDYFNRGHWLTSLQERVSLKARRKMYELWKITGTQKILDVGATPDTERKDSNCILQWLVKDGHEVSVLSPEKITAIPKVTILPPMNPGKWEIADQSFDWVFSSAVLEHAGNKIAQQFFLNEAARTSRGIFLTTPNRCHWLEFHTKLPFLHWLPKKMHRKILKMLGYDFWSKEENLNLLTRKELLQMAETAFGREFQFKVEVVWALGMPSNLILIARRQENS